MSTYIFVHGSWHGGWCWEKLAPLLARVGHVARTPDLPGHGSDGTPVSDVTLEGYARRIGEELASLHEPAVLVGHSMGGAVISEVAEMNPDNVRSLVYLAGFLLLDGQSVLDAASTDTDSVLMPSLEWAADGRTASLSADAARAAFYGRCTPADAAAAAARLCPEPIAPVATPVRLTEERFGRIPRIYIRCSEDRAVSLSLQRRLYEATPCARIESLATDHSPFYSAPQELAVILLSLAQ